MQFVLHLTSSGSQLWHTSPQGWQTCDSAPEGTVWVITDLTDESFAEIQIPRIFGRDRQGFIERQLANRFPDTPFRLALPVKPGGSFMERIAPPHQTLHGVDAAQRINSELDAFFIPMAGVWTSSMLLAHIGSKKPLPPDLFVVLPGPDALRIVFIKNRTPVLSRLIPGATHAQEQSAEIIRTLRHLENTHVLDRTAQRHQVLFLGNSPDMAELLAKGHLDLIAPPPPWITAPPKDWRFALFDLALTSPTGQLAPLSRRTKFIAKRLIKPAYWGAALSLGLALLAAGDNLRDIVSSYSSQNQIQASLQNLTRQITEVEQKMTGFGVDPTLVFNTMALEQDEITSVPDLAAQMRQLGKVISQQDTVRLTQFEWRILPPGQPACTGAAQAATGSAIPAGLEDAAKAKRVAEINFDIMLPANQREKARKQTVASQSSLLSKLEGASIIQDPAKELAQAPLQGGGVSAENRKNLSWCLTLPTELPNEAANLTTIKP